MAHVRQHYDDHLAPYYTWICGGAQQKFSENRKFFRRHRAHPRGSGVALDLGAGSGFQTIPLAEAGFRVVAIDASHQLLAELKLNARGLPVEVVCADLLNFPIHCPDAPELCVCMGDTLTHLSNRRDVRRLFEQVYTALEPGGRFILTFRDLTRELKGLVRFIPVRSDARTIFTCFLEYEKNQVKVHDLIYRRENRQWVLQKSYFKKLRIPPSWVREMLQHTGFVVRLYELRNDWACIVAGKV